MRANLFAVTVVCGFATFSASAADFKGNPDDWGSQPKPRAAIQVVAPSVNTVCDLKSAFDFDNKLFDPTHKDGARYSLHASCSAEIEPINKVCAGLECANELSALRTAKIDFSSDRKI